MQELYGIQEKFTKEIFVIIKLIDQKNKRKINYKSEIN